MKTKAFEQRIRLACGEMNNGWARSVASEMQCISLVNVKSSCTYGGCRYDSFAVFDVHLEDSVQMVSIGLREQELEFFYFGITPNEESEECLDNAYERHAIMHSLRKINS